MYSQFVIVIGVVVSRSFEIQAVARWVLAKVISTLNGALVQANNGKYRALPNEPTKLIKFNVNVAIVEFSREVTNNDFNDANLAGIGIVTAVDEVPRVVEYW